MLRMQDPYGRWNRNALTGFVTTAYSCMRCRGCIRTRPCRTSRAITNPGQTNPWPIPSRDFARSRNLACSRKTAVSSAWSFRARSHSSPQVRYWAQIALGALHNELGIPAQIKGLGDPVKMVREAARWGMRQTLLDDKGWDHLFTAYEKADDLTRESIAGALIMRADGVMTRSAAGFPRLAAALDQMMNRIRSRRSCMVNAGCVELVDLESAGARV